MDKEYSFKKEIKKICFYCQKKYKPHPRTKNIQKICGSKVCQKKHRAKYLRFWRKKNYHEELKNRAEKIKTRPLNYWKNWREKNPEYVVRNRIATRLRKQFKKEGLQRNCDISQVADNSEYFKRFYRFATSHQSLIVEGFGKSSLVLKEKELYVETGNTS